MIGGVACEIVLDEAGLDFRATKDLDIVLCVEALAPGFIEQFWSFVEEGGYQNKERSDGEKQYYRFSHPSNPHFPYMLELFARTPDGIELRPGSMYTPIPAGEEASSLSALLLDEDYYQCIHAGKKIIEGITILRTEYIIAFKARAWLDLNRRKEEGEVVDSRNVRKHRNDVFRLFPLLSPGQTIEIPQSIKADIDAFIQAMPAQQGLKITDFGIRGQSLDEVLAVLQETYGAEQAS